MYRRARATELQHPVTPHQALPLLSGEPYVALLESGGPPCQLARYSYLCFEPFVVMRARGRSLSIGPPAAMRDVEGDPFRELAFHLERYGPNANLEWTPEMPPFLGGAVGYFGYEMLTHVEEIVPTGRDDYQTPDAYFMVCHHVLAHDRVRDRSWLISTTASEDARDAEAEVEERHAEVLRTLAAVPRLGPLGQTVMVDRAARDQIAAGRPRLREHHLADSGIRSVCTREQYLEIVERAKSHIFAGDIFEVCTSQRFDAELSQSGERLYDILRSVNEAPFCAYLRFPELEVVCSSPERFLSMDRERWTETRPIKGTRPRGATPEEDEARFRDLSTCEKDHAENIMIVDLARNDLGRVCEFGSISVPELRVIERYPLTFQLVSTVRGRLKREYTSLDLVRAAFPGGSMTGAPKVEAMKIIDALEPVRRGVFSGSVGFFDFEGSFDLNIVIRTMVKIGDRVNFHVGGAIVADSDPEDEYQETLDKAHGLVMALELARSRGAR